MNFEVFDLAFEQLFHATQQAGENFKRIMEYESFCILENYKQMIWQCREVFSFNYDLYLMHCTLRDEHTQKMLTVAMDTRLAQFIQLANNIHDAVAKWGEYVRFNDITLLMNEMLDTIDHSIVFLSDCFQEKVTI